MPPFAVPTLSGTRAAGLVALALIMLVPSVRAQQSAARSGEEARRPTRPAVVMDSARARQLYVSDRPEDHPQADFERQIEARKRTDSIYAARSRGVMDYRKVSYRSGVDGLEIPAHLFQPLEKRGARGHAAMVWVHGGVHGNWTATYLPFVREAVERGYVIIAPEYRGSTGYGAEHFNAIDYGGKEVDDVASAVEHLKTLPHVDAERIGVMGWSHGGYIAAHLLFRDEHPFVAGAAIVPVTNLVFRLSYKGPRYQQGFSTQAGIRGLPFERREEYIKRSPVYQVENLSVPLLVHVATNDEDVNFVENEQMVYKLRALKPELAETKIYVDPAPWGSSGGHAFSRRVDPLSLERVDSPEQIDSWNRTWVFFEWWLRPSEDRSKPAAEVRTRP
ncbi:MAG TPA: alpha/beta fold hydrolase [Gemmatimonadaceae bacterium]|nr:alpha/beta fold hydrolase [Gemmatimonadaceae bacterium]